MTVSIVFVVAVVIVVSDSHAGVVIRVVMSVIAVVIVNTRR